jgi:hypothetical protein
MYIAHHADADADAPAPAHAPRTLLKSCHETGCPPIKFFCTESTLVILKV